MIVFDLEWNSGLYDRVRLDEILQIGAVKVDESTGKIVDSFSLFVHPQVHRRYSPAALELPDLQEAKDSVYIFPEALEAFLIWCGEDRTFASWGPSDLVVLLQNEKHWALTTDLPHTYIDLQWAFGRWLGASDNLSLEWAAEYCGAPDVFDPHNALYDALHAWVAGERVPPEYLKAALREADITPKGQKALPRRAHGWLGPATSLTALLNNRACRRGVCPKCQSQSRVAGWYRGEDGYYYARFTCAACARSYVLRMETFGDKKGKFWANTAVFRCAGRYGADYQAATRGEYITCKTAHRRRRRRSGKKPPEGS